MAYPSMNWKLHGCPAGTQQISDTSAIQRHPLGKIVSAFDYTYGEGEFMYGLGVASTDAGDLCFLDSAGPASVRALHGGAGANGQCGAAMSANVAGQYGWYQIGGAGPVKSGTVADNAALYLTATAGSVDDAAVAGDLIDGLVAKAATSAGFTTCQFNRPSVSGLVSSGGGAIVDLSRYITLSAAAEVGDAIVVTGQVKDSAGANIAAAVEVLVRTLAVTADKGDITVTAGTERKTVNPATGENVSWISTTAAGAFAVSVANDVAEATLVQVTGPNGLSNTLKLTFA